MKLHPLEKAAKHYFGVTSDLRETGYILSDGTFLDLSGRHEAEGYVRKGDRFVAKRDDYLARQRYTDHRQLPEAVTDKLKGGSGSENMLAFMQETDVLRVMPGVGFAVTRMPTIESIAAFMEGWRRAYRTDSVVVEILHPLEGHTVDTQEITDPTVDKIVEFLQDHFDSPSMGSPAQRLRFFSDCVNWPDDQVEDLKEMIYVGQEISRAVFLRSVDLEEMKELEQRLGYERDPRKGLTMAKDWCVSYYRSTLRGCPAVYFKWSAIEHVFTDLECLQRSGGEGSVAGPEDAPPVKTFTLVEQSTKEAPFRDIQEGHPVLRAVERVLDGPSHYSELEVGQKMTVRIRASGTSGIYSIWRTA